MKNNQYIKLLELPVKPQLLEQVKIIAAETFERTLAEPGVAAFFLTSKVDEPATLVLFQVFIDEEAYKWHLEQPYTTTFTAAIKDKLSAPPLAVTLTNLLP